MCVCVCEGVCVCVCVCKREGEGQVEMVRRLWDGRTSGRKVPTKQGMVPGEMFLSSRAASHLAPVPSIVILERGRREGGGREGGRRERG